MEIEIEVIMPLALQGLSLEQGQEQYPTMLASQLLKVKQAVLRKTSLYSLSKSMKTKI